MKIVIDVPDGIYYFLMEHTDRQFPYATEWIRQGKPLPKGHGDLIDVNNIVYHSEYVEDSGRVDIAYRDDIEEITPLIEADKEV